MARRLFRNWNFSSAKSVGAVYAQRKPRGAGGSFRAWGGASNTNGEKPEMKPPNEDRRAIRRRIRTAIQLGATAALLLGTGCRSVAPPAPADTGPVRSDPPPEALARFGRSVLHEYQAEHDAAIEQALAAVAADPDSERLNGRAAALLLRRGRVDEAKDLIERWIQRRPDDAIRIQWLARVYRAVGRLDEAVATSRRALATNPANADIVAEYADLLIRRGEGEKALRLLQEASSTARPAISLLRAVQMYLIWAEARERPEARETTAALLKPIGERFDLDAAAALALGHLYRRIEKTEEAFAAFDRAAALDPENDEAALFAALMKATLGREDEALAWAERAVDRVRQPVNLLRLIAELRARAAMRVEDVALAREHRLAAVAALRRVLAARPDDLVLRLALAELLLLADLPEQALVELGRINAPDPSLRRTIALRFAAGDVPAAIRRLESLSTIRPRDSQIKYILGELYLHANDCAKAVEAFHAAIAGDSPESVHYIRLAVAQAAENPDAAMETLREAGRQWSDDLHLIEARAQLHLFRSEFVDARDAYEEIERLLETGSINPDISPLFWVRSAEAHLRAGDTAGADARLRRAMLREPLAIEAFIRLTADPDQPPEVVARARRIMERLDADRGDVFISLFKGLFEHFAKNYSNAISAFETAQTRAQGQTDAAELLTPDYFFWFGAALERDGQIERAEDMMLKCLERDPDHHRALNYLAYTWAVHGLHLERALEFVKKALKLEPDNAAYLDTLGWIYFRMGRLEESLTELRRALEKEPDESEIQDHVGDVLAALGREEEALPHWRRAFVLEPDNESIREKLIRRGVDVTPLLEEAEAHRREVERRRRWQRLNGGEIGEIEAPSDLDAAPIPGLDLTPEELEELQDSDSP